MENKISTTSWKAAVFSIAVICLATALLFSCKKENSNTKSSEKNMDEIVKILDGETLSGSLASSNAAGEVTLNYNNGSQLILVAQLPDFSNIEINSSQSAALITSKYGIVIKDLNTKKMWLLANNDEESISKFEAIKSRLTGSYQSSVIFGTTIVHAVKS